MDLLTNGKDNLSACVKCGICLSACPIYRETGREPWSPRGKLALLSARSAYRLTRDRDLYDVLSNCLLCGACSEQCPGGITADEGIQQGRSWVLERVGTARGARFLAKEILPFPRRMKTLRWGQDWFWKQIPKERGLWLRFFPGSGPVPLLKKPFFLDRNPTFPTPHTPSPPTLGFFVGCSINYIHPEVGEAALKLLAPTGRIVLPQDQTCCGLPAFSLGDVTTARELARRNVLAFSKYRPDAVVVTCSSCASHILSSYPRLLEKETSLRAQLHDFLSRVVELSRFLVREAVSLPQPQRPSSFKVVFHDPCHARRKLQIRDEPRRLLLSLPGLSLREPKEKLCCGSGGLFRLGHRDLSDRIGQRLLQGLEETGADILATSCMACLMQLKDQSAGIGRPLTVKHWTELWV